MKGPPGKAVGLGVVVVQVVLLTRMVVMVLVC